MADVDKQVTIRLEAQDDLTPAFRAAAREADILGRKLDAAGNTRTFGQAVKSGLSGMTSAMRDTSSEAGRLERAVTAAGRATDRAFKGAERAITPVTGRLNDAADAADKVADKYRGMEQAGQGMLAVGAGMAVGIGAVVKQYADFDKAMSSVQANTGATGANLERLRQTAIQLGGDTQYSGKEAAEGINELAKAGVSTTDIINGGLRGALNLAAAGQMEVADAAELAASTMTQFGLRGADVGHIADLLAAGANKAQGSVHDLGMALNQVGLVADATGISVDDTVATLTAFASAGMLGSDAGTSFKTMLQRLTPQSEEAARTMQTLGLSAYDSQGNFVGMAEYAGRLQTAMAGLSTEQRTAAMNILYGADAVRAANILYQQGEAGIRQWRQQIELAGFAQKNAAALTNNLAGDWERLGGAVDTVVLQSGSGLNGFLRSMVQGAEGAVEAVGKIPAPVLQAGLAFGAVATAATLAGGAVLFLVPKVMAAKVALAELSVTSAGAATTLSVLGTAAAAVGFGIIGSQANQAVGAMSTFKAETDDLAASMVTLSKGGQDAQAFMSLMGSGMGPFRREAQSTSDAIYQFGERARLALSPTIWEQTDFIGQEKRVAAFKDQVGQLDAAFAQMVQRGQIDEARSAFDALTAAAQRQGVPVEELSAMFAQYTAAAQEAADKSSRLTREQQLAEAAALGMSDAEYEAADAAETAAKATQTFKDKVESLGSTLLSQRDAERGFQEAIDAVTESITANGTSLDIHTEKGRANQAALDAVASSGARAAAEIYNQTGSIEQAAAKVDETRNAFLQAASQFGMNSEQARLLADQLGLTSGSVMELARTLPSASGNINIGVQTTGFPEANTALENIRERMQLPPAVLQAPLMGDFVQGMATAQGIADRLGATSPVVDVSQQGAEATTGALQETTGAARTTDAQSPNVEVSQTGAQATQREIGSATEKAREFDRQSPSATVEVRGTEQAKTAIGGVIEKLRAFVSRPWIGTMIMSGASAVRSMFANADGGLYPTVRAFAAGGFEQHRAQIAPAGAWRLWAEPETGGEAYIPLAPSKRARSTAILEEVARRFGMSLVKFAEGGITAYANGDVTVPTGTFTALSIARNTVIPVTAQVTAVTIPRNVKAPFLYTPGGAWDRGTQRPDMNVTGLSKRFNDVYVSKQELLEFAERNYTSSTRLADTTARSTPDVVSTTGARSAGKVVGAAASRTATSAVVGMIGEAQKAVGTWYKWGGGHGGNNQRKELGRALVDCSGLVNVALSKTLRTNVQRSTRDWMRGGKNIQHMTVAEAMRTPGAVLVRNGHMALSIGNGRILEAPSTGKKVRERATKASEWTKGAWDVRLGDPRTGGVTVTSGDAKALRDAQQSATDAAKAYQDALKAYKTPAYVHLAKSTAAQNTYSRQFLGNLRKIRDRGYPQVAFRLLQMGEEDGAVLAASLAGAPDKVLRQQRQAFDTNAALVEEQKTLEESLGRVGGPAAWVTASKESRASAAKTSEFARYVQRIAAADPELARQIAGMGVEQGYDVARTVAALPNGGVQRRAVRKDLVTAPADAASMLAWTQKRLDNGRWMTFLNNIDTIRGRGFGTLADVFLQMGVDEAYDLAARAVKSSAADLRGMRRNYVDDPKTLTDKQRALEEKVLGPAWQQARTATTKRLAASAKFMADLEKLRANGYGDLARRYYDQGEEAAGAEAASMVAASDAERRQMQSLYAKSDAADKKWSELGDLLHNVGKVLDVAIGVATNSDPMVRWTAPMPVDARPTQAQYASVSSSQAAGVAGRGPLVHVENMNAYDPADAGSKLATRLSDAVSVSGIDRMVFA